MPAPSPTRFVLVLSTAASLQEGRSLADRILKARLAACVNLVSPIRSRYWWKGRIEAGKETLLLIKTRRAHLRALSNLIKRHHSYEVPELIALPLEWGDPAYLTWLNSV